jgi:YnbE-like lipoprotein
MRLAATQLSLSLALFGAAACVPVQLQAPDKPIEINLNVNIRQEVILRLDEEAREALTARPDLF